MSLAESWKTLLIEIQKMLKKRLWKIFHQKKSRNMMLPKNEFRQHNCTPSAFIFAFVTYEKNNNKR